MFKTRFDRNETVGVKFPIPSLTQQSEKDSTDINFIVKQYCECGVCPSCNVHHPLSEDMLAMSTQTFQEVMQQQAQLTTAFNELPANVRKKFDYNPLKMLEFVENPNNKEECVKLGLLDISVLREVLPSDFNNPISSLDGNAGIQTGDKTKVETEQPTE